MEQQKDVIKPQPRVFSHVRPGAFPFIRHLLLIQYLPIQLSIDLDRRALETGSTTMWSRTPDPPGATYLGLNIPRPRSTEGYTEIEGMIF